MRRRSTRVNESGLPGLKESARHGRPQTYSSDEVADVVGHSLTDPKTLDLVFARA
jgi:hypothetical protein